MTLMMMVTMTVGVAGVGVVVAFQQHCHDVYDFDADKQQHHHYYQPSFYVSYAAVFFLCVLCCLTVATSMCMFWDEILLTVAVLS